MVSFSDVRSIDEARRKVISTSPIPKITSKNPSYRNRVRAVTTMLPFHDGYFSAALEAYMAMDWSLLSRDKRIPLNAQVTSRITRTDASTNVLDCLGICDRLLTPEQKEKLTGQAFQSSPLTHYMKHLQTRSSSAIVHSCQRRFGSCAKDMIDMRHRWFTKSVGISPLSHSYALTVYSFHST